MVFEKVRRLFFAVCLLASQGKPLASSLAPLSVGELERAVTLLKAEGQVSESKLIASLQLKEPPKDALDGPPRIAKATIIDHGQRSAREVLLDLSANRILEVRAIKNGQPLETTSEFTGAIDYIRQDPRWQEAIRRRGITNMNEVYVSVWAGGHQLYPGLKAHRFGRGIAYFQGKQKNEQGPPIEGVEAIVDLDEKKVLRVNDRGLRTVPTASTDFYDPEVRRTRTTKLKPLVITQPEGPSFELNEFDVRWDRWQFSWSFNQREGLVLHRIRILDGQKEREILYRASISEMLVPYGSPEETWFWRNAIDEGEYGLGNCAYPLVAGQTAPPHASLLGVPVCAEDGSVAMATNRVGIYERVNESLWSHTTLNGDTIGRRSRELVVFFIATVGNYDYRYSWIFRQDGTIEFEVGMTGMLLMQASELESCAACNVEKSTVNKRSERDDRFGTLVARNTIGVNHQHFVNLRLDFDVDGTSNSIKELNAGPVEGRRNQHQNAWEVKTKVFKRESDAIRDLSPATSRHWAVFNPNVRTALGHFPAYVLEPAGNAIPFIHKSTRTRKLLGFINHVLHVTSFHEDELFAGGDYPNQISEAANVETWSKNDESIDSSDLVVWYTLGMTHVPRPEEFPVMPTARTGFRLIPKGFFTKNPALDVPEE